MRKTLWIVMLVLLGWAGADAVRGWSQAPTGAPPTSAVPDWVIKYATSQEQARRTCDVALAQEQDKTEKLTKELADTKQALAKAAKSETPAAATPEKK